MPFEIMDQSSFISKENPLPTERQVGFWKPEAAGKEEMPLFSRKRTTTPSMTSRRADDHVFGFQSDLCMQPSSEFMERNKVVLNGNYYENSLFSSSLSQIFDQKLKLSAKDVPHVQSVDKLNPTIVEDEYFGSLEEIEARTIGNLLPNDDELLSGVIDDLAYVTRSGCGDDLDDLFCSGGGIELEGEDSYNYYKTVDFVGRGASNCHHRDLNNPFGGEHTYGEHPSRTLFVRNISSNIEDSEIRNLFEQYGDIRGLYTTCKHRGFVMISYYDIRAARNAMRALQNQPLGHRKLDIHFSIPKDNPPEKDINQGTLVVFNLESSVSNDDIRQIFGVYGEIKEIRETPHKRHHKFVEFYDVRAAEAALRALNKSDVAGRKIKLEPSRPGGSRRCITQQLLPHLEQEESNRRMRETLPNNLPSRYGSIEVGTIISDVHDNGTINGRHSSFQAPIDLFMETPLNRISFNQTQRSSPPSRVNSVGNHINFSNNCELNHSLGQMKLGFQCPPNFNRHSLPEYHDGLAHGIHYGPNVIASMDTKSRPTEAFGVSGNGSYPLQHQYIWNNTNPYHPHPDPNPLLWPNSPAFVNEIPSHPQTQMHGFPSPPSQLLNKVLPLQHHHMGSAPAINSTLWDRRQAYVGNSMDMPGFHRSSSGNMGISDSSLMQLASHNILPHAGSICIDRPHVGIPSSHQRSHLFNGRNPMIPSAFDVPNARIRNRRSEASFNQVDNRRRYGLDIERIVRGEDTRTTLMIKNIPNKYTSKMLLAAIDECNRGSYDFIYLPIDFKNKCNVGYAFINMIDPKRIIPLHQAFNGKKWEKFNSEKVATLAYARIQGKAALISHFQNSSLMNEDKRCRPILFHSEGPNAGDQEPFPLGAHIRSRPGRYRTSDNEENHQESPPPPQN